MEQPVPMTARPSRLALAGFFLRLGATAFGGPAAHIAMMEDELVQRRQWLPRERFLDLLGAANLIPGPSSTELAIYLGYVLGGWVGLVLAGVCFILPAFAIVLALAAAYARYGRLPQVAGLLYGVKPVVVAIIVQAIWRMSRTAVKSREHGALGAAALAFALVGANPLAVLFGAGTLLALLAWLRGAQRGLKPLLALVAVLAVPALGPWLVHAGGALRASVPALFLAFLRVGSIVYGSGYVLLAFLQHDLVARWHWLTSAQLLDAVAVGQVTPGPVFTTATFIGYLLGGLPGATASTVGIFLPGFVLVAVSGPLIPRLRQSPVAAAFLDGVADASLAVMTAVLVQLGQAALTDPLTWALALLATLALLRWQVGSAWLVLAGAVVGLGVTALR